MRIELTSINLGGEITLVGSPRSKLRLCNVESPRYVCMYIHGYQEWSNVVCVGIKSRDCCVATSVPVSDNYPRFRTSLYFIAGTGRYFPRFIDSGYNNFSSIDRFLLRFLDFFPIPLSSSVGQERERERIARGTRFESTWLGACVDRIIAEQRTNICLLDHARETGIISRINRKISPSYQ